MDTDLFERLNSLSEKTLNEKATASELKEFNELLDEWYIDKKLNLFNMAYTKE